MVKLIGKALDWVIYSAAALLFLGWLTGHVYAYKLFGKFLIVIG